jgi:hypothetical protein
MCASFSYGYCIAQLAPPVQAPLLYKHTVAVSFTITCKSLPVLLVLQLDSASMHTVRNSPNSIYKYDASNASLFNAALDSTHRRASRGCFTVEVLTFCRRCGSSWHRPTPPFHWQCPGLAPTCQAKRCHCVVVPSMRSEHKAAWQEGLRAMSWTCVEWQCSSIDDTSMTCRLYSSYCMPGLSS